MHKRGTRHNDEMREREGVCDKGLRFHRNNNTMPGHTADWLSTAMTPENNGTKQNFRKLETQVQGYNTNGYTTATKNRPIN